MQDSQIRNIVEAALLAAGRPLTLDQLAALFGIEAPERGQLLAALEQLASDYENRGIMLAEVASGYRIQTRSQVTEWVSRLWEERPQRYTRALLETLALIAYRQPITRGEIEEVRGVSVSTNIIRSLSERGWIRVVGHRDVPGRPAMYGTTREFLDYFGLKRLDELPTLAELRDLDSLNVELDLREPGALPASAAGREDDGAHDMSTESAEDGGADEAADVELSSGERDGRVASAADDASQGEDRRDEEGVRSNVVQLKQPGSG
ncbi:MAG: SMC-Scp complex subunit ScpB [Gammaproteobacteria bacterium]|nr:SMC-Scp complex subunit ScpB [Gammaproteobacteria bacterium]